MTERVFGLKSQHKKTKEMVRGTVSLPHSSSTLSSFVVVFMCTKTVFLLEVT